MSDALFRCVAARVGAPVLTPEHFERLATLRRVIPPSFSAYYIECRLAKGAGRVDVLAGTTAKASLRTELAALAESRHAMSASPRWNALRRIVDGWCDAPELRASPCLWIEFDDLAGACPADALSLAVCLDRGYPLASEHGPGNEGMALRALELLGIEEIALQRRALSRFFAALPERGRVIHLSPMIGRPGAPLKIYGRLPSGDLGTFLRRAGWEGSDAHLEFLEHEVWKTASTSPDLYFDVAVESHKAPSIAVVFSPLELRACLQGDRHRATLLRRLTQLGLCCVDKAAALAQWVGDERLADPSVPWPTRVERWLDIKVVCEPERTFAKAYLGFRAYRTLF